VYQDALAKFDTALTLAFGNDTITNAARVGRGRAWLNLGQYDSAAAAVDGVPNDFQYVLGGSWYQACGTACNVLQNAGSVSDREGINGLPYISSRDPRSTGVSYTYTLGSTSIIGYFPTKYASSLNSSSAGLIVVADGIEAQLIRSEAALHAGDADTWLSILNGLRTSGEVDSVTWVDTVGVSLGIYGDSGRLVSTQMDTVYNTAHTQITNIYTIDTYLRPVWRAGTGGMSGLYPISDPGTAEARLDTLFTERAEWLFVTGHRQGDLRRLIREYGPAVPFFQDHGRVYPTGTYTAKGKGIYGNDVNAAIPPAEYTNPLFHGCLNRDA
jgi:hypothetical protein